jgi:hypothetical protein
VTRLQLLFLTYIDAQPTILQRRMYRKRFDHVLKEEILTLTRQYRLTCSRKEAICRRFDGVEGRLLVQSIEGPHRFQYCYMESLQEGTGCPKISGGKCIADPGPWDFLHS